MHKQLLGIFEVCQTRGPQSHNKHPYQTTVGKTGTDYIPEVIAGLRAQEPAGRLESPV